MRLLDGELRRVIRPGSWPLGSSRWALDSQVAQMAIADLLLCGHPMH